MFCRCSGASAGWEWDQGSASSTVAEWGLVCGERYKVGLVQAVFFAGCMIGEYVTPLLCSHRLNGSTVRLDGSSILSSRPDGDP